jgi:hypothetical protein
MRGDAKNACENLIQRLEVNGKGEKPRYKSEYNIKKDLKYIEREEADWLQVAHHTPQ